jgi:hypothetical protein
MAVASCPIYLDLHFQQFGRPACILGVRQWLVLNMNDHWPPLLKPRDFHGFHIMHVPILYRNIASVHVE